LFGTQELIGVKPDVDFSITSMEHYFNYYISQVILEYSHEKALIFIGIFIIITVFLKVGFYYLANYMIVIIRNGVVRDIRSKIYRKVSCGFSWDSFPMNARVILWPA
jgi:ATP-binding cassette, subfamily B, bacterial MsbA